MKRRRVWIAVAPGVALIGWGLLAWAVAPGLIEAAYRGESLPVLNDAFEGRAVHALEHYQAYWSALRFRVLIAIAAVALGQVLYLAFGRAIGRRLAPLAARIAGADPLFVPLGRVFLYTVTFGAASGLLEYAGAGAWALSTHQPIWQYSAFALWLTPVANVLALSLLAGVLSPALLRWRSLRAVNVLVFALTLVTTYAILRVALPIAHPVTIAVLATGLAVRLAEEAAARASSMDRRIRRAAPVLAGLVALLFLGQWGAGALRERANPRHADDDAPNVLILLLDTVRAHNLGLYGYQRETAPALARLGATGVVFDRAVATSSWSLPSHASLFTGRLHPELTANLTEILSERDPTLAEALGVRGYRTGAFFANLLFGREHFGLTRGFVHHETKSLDLTLLIEDSWILRTLRARASRFIDLSALRVRVSASEVNARILGWLARDSSRPFFVFANYFDAHEPYLPPAPFDTLFWPVAPRGRIEAKGRSFTAAERNELIAAYDGAIAYIDYEIGMLLAELERRDQLRNTLVIVLADHGEEFGSHGTTGHGNSLYLASIRVPLVLSFPGRVPRGLRVSEAVSILDIPATVLDLLAIRNDAGIGGAPLARYWRTPAVPERAHEAVVAQVSPQTQHPEPESYPTHYGQILSVLLGDFHYILRGDGHEEIYDVARDPFERFNLADSPAAANALRQARVLVDSVRRSSAATASGL